MLTGGTIDITAHEVIEDGRVKELITANGGNWGGTRVDAEYMDFIKCLIGNSAVQYIQQNAPHIFFEACREFENAKRSIMHESDMKFNVRIPSQLVETYSRVNKGKTLKSKNTVLTNGGKDVSISFTGDKIRLASKDAEEFFTESVKAIYRHLRRLLQQNNEHKISTIILVGGYAESSILINAIKTQFPKKRIIIPREAAWSILRGAVIFGHDPSLIKERQSKYTYGVRVWRKFDPSKHDEKYKTEKNGEISCQHLFSKIVEIGAPATVGEYQFKKNYEMRDLGSKGNFSFYTSTSKDPKYTAAEEKECSFVGYLLPPGHSFLLNETVNIMIRFGETEIEIKAHQPKSGKTAIYYLGQ